MSYRSSLELSKLNDVLPLVSASGNNAGISITIVGDQQYENFTQGWHFLSFDTTFNNKSIDSVLSSINGYYDYILEWNSTAQSFNVWSKIGKKEFTEFNENKSYFIYISSGIPLSTNGRFNQNRTIFLVNGWEAPNYIYEFPSNITNSTFFNTNFTYMHKWNATLQRFITYSKSSPTKPFTTVEKGEGYFIFTTGGNLSYVR